VESKLTGRCLCGAIRYESFEEPRLTVNCYCRDCQRSSGCAYVPRLYFSRSAVTIRGDVTYYEVVADSGDRFSRGFCSVCGSTPLGLSTRYPDLIAIRAGSLNRPEKYEPSMNIFTSDAPPWDAMNEDIPAFARDSG
jgi:hypothetical protein